MPGAGEARRVLVADDEPQICALLHEALTQQGHRVETFRDGGEVLQKVETGRYDILILDVLMPQKTGVEIVRELRGRGNGVPVLLMSSLPPDEVLKSCQGLERLAFLQKPFSLGDLRAAISRLTSTVAC